MTNAHQYSIVPKDPAAHLFEVTVLVASPDAEGQLFEFPAWIPGSYMIRDLARHVVAIRAESDGQEIELTKTGKSSWQAGACSGPLNLVAEIYAFDPSVRGAYLDMSHGFFDGACVFPAVAGQEHHTCHIDILPPATTIGADWRVATSMRPVDAGRYDFGKFVADDYAELIDHPVEMGDIHIGEFDVCGIPHAIAVYGEMHFDMARVCHDLTTLCEKQVAFLGPPKDLDRYLFLLTVREQGYGGLEHRWSSTLMCSRADLPRRDVETTSEDYRKFLGLCSHEYFHLWNVKRMKPERFTPYKLNKETHTGLLWVFEGITSYYDDLFLVRSGLVSDAGYLELLGKTVTRVLQTRGRFRQTIEESSFDAWTKLYKQDANSSNTVISYYTKGSLIALALDMTIRHESQGAYSLDDVMQECWQQYGETGKGMPERGLESLARSVTGLELADFFDRFVRGTADLPLSGLLKTVGVNLHLRAATNSKDTGGKPVDGPHSLRPWFGAALVRVNGADRFSLVHAESPAEKAGIAPGDEPVAIDGLRLTASNFDTRLGDHRAGDTVTVTVFRDHRLIRHRVRLGKAPEDTCYLSLDSAADVSREKERSKWLHAS
ncbi:MAG: M61 family metallopeptidase [Woeseiaceae bacterium]